MEFVDKIFDKWTEFRKKSQPTRDKIGDKLSNAAADAEGFWKKVHKNRKMILAVPVAAIAIILAIVNLIKLPAQVGINLLADGTYSFEVIKLLAILGPIAVTAMCLLLMFCSKRTLTPWFVSVVSLALPVILLLTNNFPA